MAIDPFWNAVIQAYDSVVMNPGTTIEIERDSRKAVVGYNFELDCVTTNIFETGAEESDG